MSITGEKKEIHRIDALICIECGACGRICPHNSVLDQYGRICSMIKRTQWMKPEVDVNKCMSCNMCIEICPVNCLSLSQPFDSGSPTAIHISRT
jgi:formate hydrogenlyase subunit 6/NADH:ubiquinone oxidoreductase subunit I